MQALIALVAVATVLWIPASADERKQDEAQAELKKWQGLWQRSPGGMEHRDGDQVVRGPALFLRLRGPPHLAGRGGQAVGE